MTRTFLRLASLLLVLGPLGLARADEDTTPEFLDTPNETASEATAETAGPPLSSPQDVFDGLETPSDFWARPTLTGDWLGARTSLQQSGIHFKGQATQFVFGIDGGVNPPGFGPLTPGGNGLTYTGRNDYNAILDLDKLVGIPHGKFLIRLEHWYGEYGNVSLNTGAFPPAVFPAALPPVPDSPGVPFLTNFLWTQPLNEQWAVFAGKKCVIGAADQDLFAGGDGTDQFMNQAFIANPAFLLGLPYTSFTAGVGSRRDWGGFAAFVYDPTDRTTEFLNVADLFSRGVIVGGEVKFKTRLMERAGEVHVGGMWKHVPLTNLAFSEPPPGVYPEPTVPGSPTLNDSYTIYTGFDQYLVQYAGTDRGWGLFGRASISDGNPTPIRYFLSAGVGGYSPVGRQRGDTFGIGWYYVGASSDFGPLPQFVFGPHDGTGVEMYYNVQVTRWLNITPDIQFIRPEATAISDSAFLYGLRVNAKF